LAHEIQQPVTSILCNTQAVWHCFTTGTLDLPAVRAALTDTIASARRTNEMIRQLLTFVTTGTLDQTCLLSMTIGRGVHTGPDLTRKP
jgi:hypothetical protein